MNDSGQRINDDSIYDMDFIITARELIRWLKEEKIDFLSLEDEKYDDLLASGSGAGYIFGTTGGVMEAVLRTAHYFLTGKVSNQLLNYQEVRGLEGIKEADVTIGNDKLHIAVVNGTKNVHHFLKMLKKGLYCSG